MLMRTEDFRRRDQESWLDMLPCWLALGSPPFESRSQTDCSDLLRRFAQFSWRMLGFYITLGHDRYFPRLLHFVTYYSAYDSTPGGKTALMSRLYLIRIDGECIRHILLGCASCMSYVGANVLGERKGKTEYSVCRASKTSEDIKISKVAQK